MNLYNLKKPPPIDQNVIGKFLIVDTQRTGSSALAEYINTHPEIACGWEWTERTPYYNKLASLKRCLNSNFSDLDQKSRNHIESSISQETNWLGFRRLFGSSIKWLLTPIISIKLFYDRFYAHINWLKRHPSVHIIHIVRRDHIAWLKSKYIAKSLGNYIGETYPEDIKLRIPVNDAIARIKSKNFVDHQLSQLQNFNLYIKIYYEELKADFYSQSSRVVQFLGCNPDLCDSNSTVIRKQSTRSDIDYILNHVELINAINLQLTN